MLTAVRSRLIRRSVLLGLPMLFLLAACGHTTRDYQEYYRVTSPGTYSARDKPAGETTLSDAELAQTGYANIGIIDIVLMKPPDLNAIKREAAARGADLIKADISSRTGHETTQTCIDVVSRRHDMTAAGGSNLADCQEYEVETTTVNLVVIKGSLWRHHSQ